MSRIRLGTNLDMSDAREPTILLTCLPGPVSGGGRADDCEVIALPDLPKCIHHVGPPGGPPCVRFYPVWCHDEWCWPDKMFCEPPVPAASWAWCPASTKQDEYVSDFTFFRNICPPSCRCSDLYAVFGVVNIWGGRIDTRESCTEASPWTCGSDCEPFSCGDVLCSGKAAVFHPDPTNATAANASEYNWIWQDWEVAQAQLCEESQGSWQPDDPPVLPWSSVEITDNRLCLVFDTPRRYRARTLAMFGPFECKDPEPPEDWCKVTVTGWDGMWSKGSGHDVTICVGETVQLMLWMNPWWLDRGMATLGSSDFGQIVSIKHHGADILGPLVWSPPHCWGQIYEQEGLVDPIADAAYDITLPVVFDVTGVALGQVTFTLGFDTGTGPSCDPLTFTADVVCCCDVTESEENWHQMGSGSLSDACGNTISTAWDEPSRTYTFYYNSTEVGRCIWDNAINSYQYRKTVDGCRFHSTRHSSSHSHNSPPCTQGCAPIGYYCWKVRYYDCVHDCAGSTFWRRSKTEQGRWGNEGEVCPGH